MKRTFILLLISSIASFGFSQNLVPSLEEELDAIEVSDSLIIDDLLATILASGDDTKKQSIYLLRLGRMLVDGYQYEKADKALQKCLELATDTAVIADANFQSGLSLMYRDIRVKSLKYFHEALDGYVVMKDSSGMGQALDKIADNHNYIGEHETARPYYDQCIKIFTAIQDTARLTNVLGNIGGMMSEDHKNDSALVYYKEAMLLNEKAGNLSNLSSDLSGIAIALEGLGRMDEALNNYYRSYHVAQIGGDDIDKAFTNQHLGYFHFNQGNYDSAQYYMTITYQYGDEMNYAQLLINSLDILHRSAYAKGDYKGAYDLFTRSKELADSLLRLENVTLINSLRSEHEMEKQEAEKKALLRQALLQERVISKQGKLNTTLIISSGLFIFATFALIGMIRTRHKKNKIIQKDRDLIRAQADRLRELDNSKSTFFANIAHDFRTPVNLIMGYMDLIKRNEPNLSGETRDYIHNVEESAERLNKMTNEINQLIQLEESHYKLDYTVIDIHDFFGTIVKMFQLGSHSNQLTFQYQNEISKGEQLHADKAALEKVIFNVLGNAYKYNTSGEMVSLHLSKDQSNLKIEVTDDGPGIQEDKLDRIFERYYRTEKGSEAALGQGIGLSLAKDLVELHNGEIKVSSEPDTCTCFVITLPLSPS